MDTGVEHGRHQEESAPGPGRPLPAPVYDDVPTTILDLRRAFADAGPADAPPLGIVTVEREHPFRAALAFGVMLLFIAGVAGGLVVGIAAAGKSLYEKASGPPTCSAGQVANGAALTTWLEGVRSNAVGVTGQVVRSGCVTEGLLDPQTGQAAAVTVPWGKPLTSIAQVLTSEHDCQFGQPSATGVRVCTVSINDRLAAVELRPTKATKSTTVTVTFR